LLSISRDIPGFRAAHDHVLEYDFTTFIGGHLTRRGRREDVLVAQRYVQDVREAAEAALRATPRPEFIAELGQEVGFENKWYLVEAHAQAVVDQCTETVLDAWEGKLGGVAIHTESNCRAMQYSLRVD
jgi:diaminopimelate decarboxylase